MMDDGVVHAIQIGLHYKGGLLGNNQVPLLARRTRGARYFPVLLDPLAYTLAWRSATVVHGGGAWCANGVEPAAATHLGRCVLCPQIAGR